MLTLGNRRSERNGKKRLKKVNNLSNCLIASYRFGVKKSQKKVQKYLEDKKKSVSLHSQSGITEITKVAKGRKQRRSLT